METNKGLRLWQFAVITLVLCNIGLMVTIWVRPAIQRPPHPVSPREFVIKNIGFSNEQITKYDVLVQEHRAAMNQLRKQAGDYRQLLFANLKTGNTTYADSLEQLIAGTQKQIERTTYDHFALVRNICTDAQKLVFDKIIGDVTRQMNGMGHPPPQGDRPGPPQGDMPQGPPPPDAPPPGNP